MRSKKNAQYMVGIERDSAMQKFYLEEARKHGLHLPKYIALLLQDRYEALQGRGQGVWFPRYMQSVVPVAPSLEEHHVIDAPVSDVKTDVSNALSAFGGEDED